MRIRSLLQEPGRMGPAPQSGYRGWLGTQRLPEEVKLCVETLLAMRSLADHKAQSLAQRLLAMARLHPLYEADKAPLSA